MSLVAIICTWQYIFGSCCIYSYCPQFNCIYPSKLISYHSNGPHLPLPTLTLYFLITYKPILFIQSINKVEFNQKCICIHNSISRCSEMNFFLNKKESAFIFLINNRKSRVCFCCCVGAGSGRQAVWQLNGSRSHGDAVCNVLINNDHNKPPFYRRAPTRFRLVRRVFSSVPRGFTRGR